MKSILRFIVICAVLFGDLHAQEYTIKFATLAPEGTSWMNIMKEFDAAVRKETGGKVGFRIYPGGVQGDEKVVLRKIRSGQLHAGGFTGVAMGEIASKVRILDTPFLFMTYAEIDHIYEAFDEEFRKAFEENGYVLLGWAEVGFVHVFTNTAINRPQDLKSLKMWAWEGDPIAETLFRELEISPIPLAMTDVMTSLQTRLIDAFYTSPYAALTLQWYTRAKYMIDVPLADAAGAVLVSKKFFDRIPPDLQEVVLRSSKVYFKRLVQMTRKDNADAVEAMKQRGISLIKADEKDYRYYVEVSERARRKLVGRLYSEEFLGRIETALESFRNKNKTAR